MKKSNLKFLLGIFLITFFTPSCKKADSYSEPEVIVNSEKEVTDNYDVSAENAACFATTFLSKHSKLKSTLSVRETKRFKTPIKKSKLYVVNFEPNGFVLMSGNMQHIPILAFSENSNFEFSDFDQLPSGMKEWISEAMLLNYELETDSILEKANDVMLEWQSNLPNHKLKSTDIINPDKCRYTNLGHSIDIFDDCLMPTQWHQNSPYNLNTPICSNDGTHTPAGCVAVAIAQVMNYWKYPSNFNWSILQNTYSTSTTPSAIEVARLMKDIGTRLNMDYSCDGSSATSNKAKKVLDDDYGYNNSISYSDWNIDVIRNNLRWGYPVILGGYRTRNTTLTFDWYTNGHAWVCDGLREEYDNFKVTCTSAGGVPLISYETRNYRCYLHMNWGWGNTSQNVWYFSNSLTNPNGTDRNYKWKTDMITNIHP